MSLIFLLSSTGQDDFSLEDAILGGRQENCGCSFDLFIFKYYCMTDLPHMVCLNLSGTIQPCACQEVDHIELKFVF